MTPINIISQYINLHKARTNNWHPVLCKVCNDHGKKGPRAAFKFDGDKIVYNCFNCNHRAMYNVSDSVNIPDKMQIVFTSFGIPLDIWNEFQLKSLSSPVNKTHQPKNSFKYNIPETVKLLPFFKPLTLNENSNISLLAKEYLEVIRGINYQDYSFYVCDDKSVKNSRIHQGWYGRLIIPVTFMNNIVYYQGRDLLESNIKYKNSSGDRTGILFGYDKIRNLPTDNPIYVVEGFFDSYHIEGVGILGNQITTKQAYWLNQLPNRKVYIPDHHSTGYNGAIQALSHGWSIATPDIGKCKDINEAIVKYGLIYVLDQLQETESKGKVAEIKAALYCNV